MAEELPSLQRASAVSSPALLEEFAHLNRDLREAQAELRRCEQEEESAPFFSAAGEFVVRTGYPDDVWEGHQTLSSNNQICPSLTALPALGWWCGGCGGPASGRRRCGSFTCSRGMNGRRAPRRRWQCTSARRRPQWRASRASCSHSCKTSTAARCRTSRSSSNCPSSPCISNAADVMVFRVALWACPIASFLRDHALSDNYDTLRSRSLAAGLWGAFRRDLTQVKATATHTVLRRQTNTQCVVT